MYVTEKFKIDFKQESKNRREDFFSKVSTIFNLPEYHFARCILGTFYQHNPKIRFDKEIAGKLLQDLIGTEGFSFYDFTKEFMGGYPINRLDKDYYTNGPRVGTTEDEDLNWAIFIDKIKSDYWKDESRRNSYALIQAFDLYEDRKPKTAREKRFHPIVFNGKEIYYKFFNVKQANKFYTKLFEKYFHDFELIAKISDAKIKRYGKEIYNGLFLGLYIDYSLLKQEMKMGYLEFPRMKVELFSNKLNSPLKPDDYVIPQNKYDIGRVNLQHNIGNTFNNFRIGNSSQKEEELKRDLYFYSEVNAYYLRMYLEEVEHIVLNLVR